MDKQFMKAAKFSNCEECVVILLDEMHIREDLVFDKSTTGTLVFC